MNVGIVAQKGNERAARLADDIRDRLAETGVSTRLDEAAATLLGETGTPVSEFGTCDLVVSIGGDGTFLLAARGAGDAPMLGVNLGEVGFLNAVSPEEAVDTVHSVVDAGRKRGIATRDIARIAAEGDGWRGDAAMNEVVVQGPRRGRGGGIDVEVLVDGSQYSVGHVDGVLVATPTGSTAYNLSEDGPLVHPAVDSLVVNEMCAGDGMPPLVAAPDATVTVRITGGDEAVVVSDGRSKQVVEPPTEVQIGRTEPPVRLAGPASDFFRALDKLD
ncbi:NAD(+)/NADH kinase [Halobium salinum]|uniref:NAD kinase n=1 Tax=Halobium salinum TaxID=1364940 RepID=A0ABD5P9V4_9EURY|nr:NAD(+)/NADH kinase [Halobium salinum]